MLLEAQNLGLGAQFGGKYFAHDIRVIRLPRHGASCPIGMGVSCSADRNIKAKINRQGIWIEKLEHNPGKYIPEELRKAGEGEAVRVDLNRPMKEILEEGDLHYGHGEAGTHAPGMSQRRMLEVEIDVLDKNNRLAERNRARFAARKQLVLNLVSSPGSGKTTLLTEAMNGVEIGALLLTGGYEMDARISKLCERAFATGLPVFMVNTNTWQTSLSLQSFNLEVPVDDHERIEKVQESIVFK